MSHQLHEGLERHSLEYLVSPVITVDEYESKIDDRRMIVTGFYVRDYQPARDLSQFIEKSSIRPSDTDVSPAPTDDGFYLVFVEMTRDDEWPDRIMEMIDQIENLTNISQWQFKAYGSPETRKLSAEALRDSVNLNPKKVEIEPSDDEPAAPPVGPDSQRQTAAESIGQFLRPSLCETIQIRDQHIRITNGGAERIYKITDWREKSASIPVFGLNIGSKVLHEAMTLERWLGPTYTIDTADDSVVISDGDHTLVLSVDS